MNKSTILILLFPLCTGCIDNQITFDKTKWNTYDDGFFPYREMMISDLMSNHLKNGMTYEEVNSLLGTPTNFDQLEVNTFGYTVMEDYGWNIDPVETKTLWLTLSNDSTVINFELDHSKH